MKYWLNVIFAFIGSSFTYLFGGWDNVLFSLILFVILDQATGLIVGAYSNTLNSKTGTKGILKKSTILIVMILAVTLDRLLNDGSWLFRTLVAYFYIANEGISILENCGKLGLPIPQKILDTLEQLKEKGEIKK